MRFYFFCANQFEQNIRSLWIGRDVKPFEEKKIVAQFSRPCRSIGIKIARRVYFDLISFRAWTYNNIPNNI